MNHWLIVYRRSTGELVECTAYGQDGKGALAARFSWELRADAGPDLEIVTLGADSLDTLRVTHSRYFQKEGKA